VAHRLHAAIRKLRLRTSTDVVRLYHHLRGAPVELVGDGVAVATVESGSRSAAEFTAAEREVLALIARGMSNAGVARARGTAQRTVANQIAALLRKTGCGSRRELVARFAPSPSRS
jgi:DNA-binding CsgD family transcriptional regulator